MISKQISNISKESFSKYGIIIDHEVTKTDHFFEVLITEENAGWRIAFFEISRKATNVMECHSASCESFEPVRGTTLLFVAENSSPENYEVFLLDKPVCLYKGIWHQVITLSEYSQIKITENFAVDSEFYYFDDALSPIITKNEEDSI